MKRAIFGGRFDPPHNGHIMIAEAVLSSKKADEIIFVPSYFPPHKNESPTASFEDRFAMLKIVSEETKSMQVSDIEKRLAKKPSYTFYVMENLAEEFKDDELILLIGADNLLLFHTWHKADEMIRRWQILTYPRPGFELSLDQLNKLWPDDFARKLFNSILNMPTFDISSSQIRNMLMQPTKNISDFLPEKVLSYILDKKLYSKT